MKNEISTVINVDNNQIRILRIGNVDYISLTDLAKYQNNDNPSGVIFNWMSNKDSFAFYSLWEEINNEDFNSMESHRIKIEEAPYNRFTMTPTRWKKDFNAIGIIPSSGKYSIGTFAHPDIAFEFTSWLSPEFKLYLITEFQRLKKNEAYQNQVEWSARRSLSKTNYRIHTDSIKEYIVPKLTHKQKVLVYANEADVINVSLFGMTAKEWRDKNLNLDGNIRDYTDILHLVVLSNLEVLNANMIANSIEQKERLEKLNNIARKELEILSNDKNIISIQEIDDSMVKYV